MKKLFLVLIASLALGATTVSAAPKTSVNFNVLGVLINYWSGSFETVLPMVPNVSVKADVGYSPNFFWATNLWFFNLSGEGRYYFSSMLPKGLPEFLYGEPLAGVFGGVGAGFYSSGYKYTIGSDSIEGSWMSPDLFFEVGDKYFFDKHFYAEGYTGFDIVIPPTWTWKVNGTTVTSGNYGYTGSTPGGFRLGVNFGYAF